MKQKKIRESEDKLISFAALIILEYYDKIQDLIKYFG